MMENKTCFKANVCFNSKGEVSCFCYERDKCLCLESNTCFEALVNIDIVNEISPIEKISKNLESFSRNLNKSSTNIKKGLSELERAIRKNTSFK